MPTKKTTANHHHATPLRRSPRLLNQNPPSLTPQTLKISRIHANDPTTSSKKPKKAKSYERSDLCPISASGWRRSPRLSNGSDKISILRRSPRLSLLGNTNKKLEEKSSDVKATAENFRKRYSKFGLQKRKKEKCLLLGSCDEVLKKGSCDVNFEVVMGLEATKGRDVCERREEVKVAKKRKRGEEKGNDEGRVFQGWTKEQEMALQRAYFAAKPTPNFWKKVSKLVPGKSAQDCFDKVHSDQVTPLQPLPRSRAKKLNSSPVECLSFSASKLLNPTGLKFKKLSYTKRKSHLAQKTVRELLEKLNRIDPGYEADLFSILEPNPSTEDCQLNVALSTPKQLQEKSRLLQKCNERSSSGQKRSLSRLKNSCRIDVVSPPVLKQVKNRALHEKYIDQLRCRDAKRKAACEQAGKSVMGKQNRGQINGQKIDVVRAAKNALVSHAREAIDRIQHLGDIDTGNSSDFNNDGVDNDEDEGEVGVL